MRLFSRFAVILSTAFITLFFTSCDPDTPGTPGGVTLPPIVTLNSGVGLVSFNQELSLASPSFIVNVSGQDGDAELNNLRILENGTIIPFGQLDFRTGQTPNNPISIPDGDALGFTYEIEINPSNTAPGPVTFTFVLTDDANEVSSTEVTVTYTVTAPVIDLLVEDGFVSGDVTVTTRNPSFDVRVRLDDTADPLATFTVLEDGVEMDANALTFNDGALDAMNPLNLVTEESTGVTYKVNIRPNVDMNGSRTYTFIVTDVNGVTAQQTVTVTYEIPPGTAITFDMTGVFFNASGQMLGGLDLDNGTAVAYNSPDAEIEDEGVNLDEPGAEKWRTQISASNDAILRIANLNVLGDGITFDDIDTQEDITTLYDQGNGELGGDDDVPDTQGDDSREEIVTRPLREGDVFAVRRGSRFYLVRIDAINFVASSNNDNYSVSIKY